MKKLLSILMLLALSFSALAQQTESTEKIVTSKWSLLIGSASIADHYFTNQEYSGPMMGLSVEFGSFYKKNKNLSWELDMTYIGLGSPSNPAGTGTLKVYDGAIEYKTSYNWNPVKNLHLRAGGSFDLNLGANFDPNGINNVLELLFQPQIKAVAGIRYGWNFKKMNLNLYADLGLPVMGLATVGSKYEGTSVIINNLIPYGMLKPAVSHVHFTSFHNLQGYNLDLGLDLEFKHLTFSMSVDTNNKWWNAYDSQAYKNYTFFNLGFSVDLVSRSRLTSNNRYF
jgi:hypothetical protein